MSPSKMMFIAEDIEIGEDAGSISPLTQQPMREAPPVKSSVNEEALDPFLLMNGGSTFD